MAATRQNPDNPKIIFPLYTKFIFIKLHFALNIKLYTCLVDKMNLDSICPLNATKFSHLQSNLQYWMKLTAFYTCHREIRSPGHRSQSEEEPDSCRSHVYSPVWLQTGWKYSALRNSMSTKYTAIGCPYDFQPLKYCKTFDVIFNKLCLHAS